MSKTYISDEMRSILGCEYNEQVSYPIDPSDIRRWAIATYYPDPPPRLFYDESYAKTTPYGGIVAPEDFNPFAWITAVPSGFTATLNDPTITHALRTEMGVEGRHGVKGPGLQNQLNGGSEFIYPGARMRPGDVIRSVTTIADYTEKEGRLGLMLFTTQQSTWTNQRAEVVRIARSVLIRY